MLPSEKAPFDSTMTIECSSQPSDIHTREMHWRAPETLGGSVHVATFSSRPKGDQLPFIRDMASKGRAHRQTSDKTMQPLGALALNPTCQADGSPGVSRGRRRVLFCLWPSRDGKFKYRVASDTSTLNVKTNLLTQLPGKIVLF